ncbi:unnamed protein product [Gordionus sp. m RMFG-2023]|uniref:DENN domain-containing protein 5B-like n=1 Tax=Gordionus sp. m RMFG-2023 TaxID=3053472 RepID=UPI0030DECC66
MVEYIYTIEPFNSLSIHSCNANKDTIDLCNNDSITENVKSSHKINTTILGKSIKKLSQNVIMNYKITNMCIPVSNMSDLDISKIIQDTIPEFAFNPAILTNQIHNISLDLLTSNKSNFPQYHTFTITDSDGYFLFGFVRNILLHKVVEKKSKSLSYIKCLVLLSHKPWHKSFYLLLDHLGYLSTLSESSHKPQFCSENINKFLDILYHKYPENKFKFCFDNKNVDEYHVDIVNNFYRLHCPSHSRVTLIDFPLESRDYKCDNNICDSPFYVNLAFPSIPESIIMTDLYKYLSISSMISYWTNLLRENRIILVSDHLDRISHCAFAGITLLYPMYWQHVFIPVLPASMLEILNAPMPYLIGMSRPLFDSCKLSRHLTPAISSNGFPPPDNNVSSTTFSDQVITIFDLDKCLIYTYTDSSSFLPNSISSNTSSNIFTSTRDSERRSPKTGKNNNNGAKFFNPSTETYSSSLLNGASNAADDDVGNNNGSLLPNYLVTELKEKLTQFEGLCREASPDTVGPCKIPIAFIFFRTLLDLIGNYRAGLNFDPGQVITFNPKNFVKTARASLRPCLEEIVKSQMFQQFITERLHLLNGGLGFNDAFERAINENSLQVGNTNSATQLQKYVNYMKGEGDFYLTVLKRKTSQVLEKEFFLKRAAKLLTSKLANPSHPFLGHNSNNLNKNIDADDPLNNGSGHFYDVSPPFDSSDSDGKNSNNKSKHLNGHFSSCERQSSLFSENASPHASNFYLNESSGAIRRFDPEKILMNKKMVLNDDSGYATSGAPNSLNGTMNGASISFENDFNPEISSSYPDNHSSAFKLSNGYIKNKKMYLPQNLPFSVDVGATTKERSLIDLDCEIEGPGHFALLEQNLLGYSLADKVSDMNHIQNIKRQSHSSTGGRQWEKFE